MKNWIITLLFALSSLIACQPDQSDIVGKWTVESMTLGEEVLTADEVYNPIYNFYNDGSYDILMGDYAEKGTWELNEKVFTLTTDKGELIQLTIVHLSNDELNYEIGEDGSKTSVILTKNK